MSSSKFTLNFTLSCPVQVSAMAAHDVDIQLRAEDDEFAGDMEDDTLDTLKSRVTTKKGRGFEAAGGGHQGDYESIDHTADGPGPMRSVEGWIVFVSNLHEEAQEEDIHDKFAEYGEIKNIHVNLDRRTGFLKGYALIEYETFREANLAIQKSNGSALLGKKVDVDWAFVKPKERGGGRRGGKW